MKIYFTSCSYCKTVEPIYEAVAKIYEHAPNIELARVNMDKNEVKGVTIMVYPTFKFFNTTNDIIDYNLQPSVDNFEQFIDTHAVGCKTCWKKNKAVTKKDERDEL